FRLALDQARLVHVDASAASLNGHYPARIAAACDVPALIRALTAAISPGPTRQGWAPPELQAFRRSSLVQAEPVVPAAQPANAAGFFGALREALPPDALLVTDSGLHQMLARRHFQVLAPRTLIAPTNFQSMGFALPAAIGAKLAHPARQVVALIGDGGLAMSGMEMLTAVRERVTLTVIGMIDGHYGLIRQQQLGQYGHAHGTTLLNPDYARWTASLGAGHILYDGNDSLRSALKAPRPTLLEVPVQDSLAMRIDTVKARARAALKSRRGPEIVA
ncbi:MAG: thiamine pyrophosphate-dependent enzyme, partial [Lysobacter sp.]